MAKKSLVIKHNRLKERRLKALKAGKKMPLATRVYNRCEVCGRTRGFFRKFGMCRICVRQLAHEGLIMGLHKSSW